MIRVTTNMMAKWDSMMTRSHASRSNLQLMMPCRIRKIRSSPKGLSLPPRVIWALSVTLKKPRDQTTQVALSSEPLQAPTKLHPRLFL